MKRNKTKDRLIDDFKHISKRDIGAVLLEKQGIKGPKYAGLSDSEYEKAKRAYAAARNKAVREASALDIKNLITEKQLHQGGSTVLDRRYKEQSQIIIPRVKRDGKMRNLQLSDYKNDIYFYKAVFKANKDVLENGGIHNAKMLREITKQYQMTTTTRKISVKTALSALGHSGTIMGRDLRARTNIANIITDQKLSPLGKRFSNKEYIDMLQYDPSERSFYIDLSNGNRLYIDMDEYANHKQIGFHEVER